MVINGYSDYKTYLGRNREPGPARNAGGDHYKNFVDAVRAKDKKILNGPVETAYQAAALRTSATSPTDWAAPSTSTRKRNCSWVTKRQTPCSPAKYRAPYVVPTTV